MKKTIMTLLVGLCCSLGVSAQNANTTPFEQNKIYLGASVTGLGFSYNQTEKWNGALQFKGGYLFEDNWMVTGQLGYDYHQNASNAFAAGIGLRYYLEDFGVYVGAGANYKHAFKTYDDFIDPESVVHLKACKLEPSLADVKPGERFQFVRLGYFCRDTKNTGTFNRIVSLKDSYKPGT